MASTHNNKTHDDAVSKQIDAQAEKLLRDIEGTSPFVLRTSYSPEDLDPSDVAAPEAAEVSEQPGDGFEEEAHMEVPQVQVVKDAEQVVAYQQAEAAAEQTAHVKRHRLRNALIAAVVVLVAVAAVIGVLVWRGTANPDVAPSDTAALDTATAGSEGTVFQAIDGDMIPAFAKLFGKSIDDVQASTQGKLVLRDGNTEASDSELKDLAYMRDASLINKSGVRYADVSLGLNKSKKLIYVYVRYDIDALGVADADFQTLVSDGTVAKSLLEGMGLKDVALEEVQVPEAQRLNLAKTLSESDDDVHEYQFTGTTGSKNAPKTWEVIDSYDYSVGKLHNDNSVIRCIKVELR